MDQRVRNLIFFLVLSSTTAGFVASQPIPPFLSGQIELVTAQGKVSGVKRNSLLQKYRANVQHDFGAAMNFRAGASYQSFDLESPELTGALRRELQPYADLLWKHPLFGMNSSVRRRQLSLISMDGHLITDDAQVGIRSSDPELPLLSLQFGWQHIHGDEDIDRNIRDRRLEARIQEDIAWSQWSYGFTRRASENVVSNLATTQNEHLLRLTAARTPIDSERIKLVADYRFNHRWQRDRSLDDSEAIEQLSPRGGLYALDPSPDFGELLPLDGLVDGLRDTPTQPPIEVGGDRSGQNVGLDLGITRASEAIYLYVDGISGDDLIWSVYRSEDNLNWERVGASYGFNPALRRYELRYPPTQARYVKAVNSGVNQITDVRITEIEVFAAIEGMPEQSRSRDAHLATVRVSGEWSTRWQSSLDLSYRHEPAQGDVGNRQSTDYALRTSFQQTPQLGHHLRWEQAFQQFQGFHEDLRDDALAYSVIYDPIPAVHNKSAASTRIETLSGTRSREVHSLSSELWAQVWRGLRLSSGLSTTRSLLYVTDTHADSWTVRAGSEAALTRSIRLDLNWSHQQVRSDPGNRLRVRQMTGAGADLQLSRSIGLRSNVYWVADVSNAISQDHLLSWTMTPNLRLSLQAMLNAYDEDAFTTQYSAHLNYQLNPRSSLFLRYSSVDLSEAGGNRSEALQQGLRTSF